MADSGHPPAELHERLLICRTIKLNAGALGGHRRCCHAKMQKNAQNKPQIARLILCVHTTLQVYCNLFLTFCKFPRRTAFAVPPPMRGALPCPARKKETAEAVSFFAGVCTYLARALLASAISAKMPACFLATMARMTNSVPTIRATAISRLTNTFWIRPARMKLTKDTAATVSA